MSEKGREVYHPLMASTECKAQALSAVSVTVETAAHISTSPRESKTPPGDQGREISKTRKENISSAVRFPCQAQGSKEEEEGGEGCRGWGDVEGYNENMSAGSHSSIAPKWTAFCDYTENKVKVKIEELTGVQQLYLYLTCTVCLQTQSQLSLYSINLGVKGSVNKAIQMDGVMLWEFNRELVYIHRYVIYTCSDAVTWLTSCWGG